MLDIIVTHYKEPWEVGKKFFDMLDLQRGVDFSQFQVILVNDGEENELPDKHFENRHYQVKQISIPHGGVSAARNAGLKTATNEWVMFCDFDDIFSNVYAVRYIQDVMPAHGFDMLWGEIVIEDNAGERTWCAGDPDEKRKLGFKFSKYGNNLFFVHGKLFRREFLLKNGIAFDESTYYSEDTLFCRYIDTIIDHKKIGEIKMEYPFYIWTYTDGSVTTRLEQRYDIYQQMFYTNKKTCEAFKRNLPYERYCAMVYRTVWEVYGALNIIDPIPDELNKLKEQFKEFWKEHKNDFLVVSKEAEKQIDEIKKNETPPHGRKSKKIHFNKQDFLLWIDTINQEIEEEGETK